MKRYYYALSTEIVVSIALIIKSAKRKKMNIEIPLTPPSINKYIGRTNIWEYHKNKKEFQQIARLTTLKDKPSKPIEHCKIDITYCFKDKRLRDTNNYDKMVLDFLVESGFIKDDNIFVIEETTTRGTTGKEEKTIIKIEEIE